jgi:hypothetical protein
MAMDCGRTQGWKGSCESRARRFAFKAVRPSLEEQEDDRSAPSFLNSGRVYAFLTHTEQRLLPAVQSTIRDDSCRTLPSHLCSVWILCGWSTTKLISFHPPFLFAFHESFVRGPYTFCAFFGLSRPNLSLYIYPSLYPSYLSIYLIPSSPVASHLSSPWIGTIMLADNPKNSPGGSYGWWLWWRS